MVRLKTGLIRMLLLPLFFLTALPVEIQRSLFVVKRPEDFCARSKICPRRPTAALILRLRSYKFLPSGKSQRQNPP